MISYESKERNHKTLKIENCLRRRTQIHNILSTSYILYFDYFYLVNRILHTKMSKRPADSSGDSGSQPPIKKVQFEPILIGPISTLEEMDMKVLQFQNKKLAQVKFILYILYNK